MTLFKPLFFTALIPFAACAPAPPAPQTDAVQDAPAQLWTTNTRTILTDDAARALTHQCSRISPGPVERIWTPGASDIEVVEDTLILEVARQQEARGDTPSPGGYYRQYAGFVIGGRRIIYINGVDESAIQHDPDPGHPFDWRTQAVQICDGGPITFGAEYDPATRRIFNFAFNGSV